MNTPLPFFNWSLKRTLGAVPDSFDKARIRIIYTILLFSLLKGLVVIGVGTYYHQDLQVVRAVLAVVTYTGLTKVLLSRPSAIRTLAHIMILTGIIMVWTNIFIYSHNVNLVTVQFIFMIALSSFYTMGTRWGVGYSAISMLPVLVCFLMGGDLSVSLGPGPQTFVSPGFEIIAMLNFVSIVAAHYLFYQAFVANIKEKEALNAQLQIAVAEAHELAASKTTFLSTMSHELRTPLNSVVGIAELLLDDEPEERHKEYLNVLQFSALDLLSLINNVLDLNKIDSDKLVLETVPFSLAEFMRNISSGLRLKAGGKELAYILDIDPQLRDVYVAGDPTRLSQVVYNLVSNAIKFTQQGSITVSLQCVHHTPDEVHVLFSVADTGIGIAPSRHEHVFGLFNQAESDTTRRYGGTGLGLAIVRQVVGLLGSTVNLQSSPGNGSTFSFTIPFTTVAPQVREDDTAIRPAMTGLRVLVAEDYEFNRMILKMQLDKLELDYTIVENGRQAYEATLTGGYHAILLDLHMPEMDGYETIRRIRAHADAAVANACVIAFTASVTEQQKIFDSGFDDYLYKPVNMNDLREKLEKVAPVQAMLQ